MIPIGVVTRDRHAVLDVTLRSLSASDLPEDQVLVVFDDGSHRKSTKDYLYTSEGVHLGVQWPKTRHWLNLGLGDVQSKAKGRGLAGKVHVVRLGPAPLGVVNASCRAFCLMVEKFGGDHGIIMGQDDVVFNSDWMTRLIDAEQHPVPNRQQSVGLITGCWINKKNAEKREPMTFVSGGGITAQCYYVTPAGVAAVLPWAKQCHTASRGFDNKFCAHIRDKADVYRMHPAVCQHIGLESLVRPGWRWTRWHAKGRIDFSGRGPYPLAKYVRSFKS